MKFKVLLLSTLMGLSLNALAKSADITTAKLLLGDLYYYGFGTEIDKSSGMYWYVRAATQGNAEAQFIVGINYLMGDALDSLASMVWFEKAAAQGHARAICGMGFYYQHGISSDDENVPPLLAIDEKKRKPCLKKVRNFKKVLVVDLLMINHPTNTKIAASPPHSLGA
ncbi:tetratricopeptide repeat protein [Lonepinella sp. BR2474]|uniref:tetratricopeptide repeat protein n=1 Tax=Lonepinella sp. BR2474 TaxID=3434548 RepID=UPI003F6E373D